MRSALKSLLALALLLVASRSFATTPGAPVALVVGLKGEAVRIDAAGRPAPLRLFDKLAAGAVLETRAASEVHLVFNGGGRFALRASSRARIGGAEPVRQSGTVATLAPLPAGLQLAPIAPEDDPGDRFPTIVIRSLPIKGVYPRGAVTLAPEEAVLRFDRVPGTETYHVVVTEHRTGDPVFTLDTAETRVALPAATLKPGTRYHWTVATLGRIGARAEGRGEFTTYSPATESARAALDAALAGEPEAEALLLKVAVDLNLGRFREVYEELQLARTHYPDDEGLKAAVESWRKRLEVAAPPTAGLAKPAPPAENPQVSSKTPDPPHRP